MTSPSSTHFHNNASKDILANNSVVCLMAPTASGKTALAYELYDTGRYELISVDSALIYRDMNIGTAKPTIDELTRYPHHLVDIIEPTQSYSVAEFVSDVDIIINNCHQNDKIPLLVGGTMMYYMALLDGLSPVPDSDDLVRMQVGQWYQEEGADALYDYLGKVDAITHARLKPTDSQRITRAIEVYQQTHIPISEWQKQPKQALAHNGDQQWHALSVMPDRPWLHERIAQRLDIMWDEGLVDEVIGLLERYPLTPNLPAMRCVGYRQVLEYLVRIDHPVFDNHPINKSQFYAEFGDAVTDTHNKNLAFEQMQDKTLYATRQLAKRQYTWLRKLSVLPNVSYESTPINRQSLTSMSQARDYLL